MLRPKLLTVSGAAPTSFRGRGVMIVRGESIGSSVVKTFGSPSGAGTTTRCGTFGSGNFGPPERGSFTISRFVMICPRRARLVERRALKDRATGGSEQGRERVNTGAE